MNPHAIPVYAAYLSILSTGDPFEKSLKTSKECIMTVGVGVQEKTRKEHF